LGSQFHDGPHVGDGQIEGHDVLNAQINLPGNVEYDSEDGADGSDGKVGYSHDLGALVLGDNLSFSVPSSVEETIIGDVKWDTDSIQYS